MRIGRNKVTLPHMKLYTRSGDDGTTGLFGAGRVPKDSIRVTAYGQVDELNAALGLAASICDGTRTYEKHVRELIDALQNALFDLGADLATPPGSKHEQHVTRLSEQDIHHIEKTIDEIEDGNDALKTFILPGGTELAARLHLARTICRRAERDVVTLERAETINHINVLYLNRLSDLLFALARRVNKESGVGDVQWKKQ